MALKCLKKSVENVLIAVENTDVYLAVDASHASFGTELPVEQVHVGLVFAIASDPNIIIALEVGSQG